MMNELKDAQRIDFNMTLKSKGLNKLIRDLFDQMPGKPPQSTYKGRLRNCMRIILINLNNTDEYISYSRNDHSKEYRRKNYSAKNIRKVVDFLIYNGWVENERGYCNDDPDNRRMSRMRCPKKLRELFVAYHVNQNNIRIDGKKNLIILRDDASQSIPYIDTGFTLSAKNNIERINEMLLAHSISYENGFYMHRKLLHRVFNRDFNHGGRFYGGEWQSKNCNARLRIKIDNSPVVELDFQALHPTMLYALNDLSLNEDPYSLKGYSNEIRGFLKRVMLVLINTGDIEKTRRTIQGMINSKELSKPAEVTNLKGLIQAFIDKHFDIYNLFNNNTGRKLQRLDSDICESVQMHFAPKDIPVLSVYDSFIISANYEKRLLEAMEEAFYNKFNKKCQITKKGKKKS